MAHAKPALDESESFVEKYSKEEKLKTDLPEEARSFHEDIIALKRLQMSEDKEKRNTHYR